MIICKKPRELHDLLEKKNIGQHQIGFVPTMGALHAGHLSLVDAAKKQNKIVVCSIFVNPTQFNDPQDFKKYPITLEKDILMFEGAGCDVLFIPSVENIYPNGTNDLEHYDLGFLETVLEGKFRPGHFQGVCMVVHRLLEIVNPGHLYLGQKDYQQCMVITRLLELISLKNKTEIIICPTLREEDGLAMSSRNMRLDKVERKKAATIYRSLNMIKENDGKETPDALKKKAQLMLEEDGFKVDYVEIADANDLSPISVWDEKQKAVALVAAFMNEVRLIDNMVI